MIDLVIAMIMLVQHSKLHCVHATTSNRNNHNYHYLSIMYLVFELANTKREGKNELAHLFIPSCIYLTKRYNEVCRRRGGL